MTPPVKKKTTKKTITTKTFTPSTNEGTPSSMVFEKGTPSTLKSLTGATVVEEPSPTYYEPGASGPASHVNIGTLVVQTNVSKSSTEDDDKGGNTSPPQHEAEAT
jgi:hypothetical protein